MKELQEKMIRFRDERNWKQYHKPKDLAISIALEASELLENFQWRSDEEALSENFEHIQDEMADIFLYLISMSEALGVDLVEIAEKKLVKNAQKYPVDKVYGSREKYTQLKGR